MNTVMTKAKAWVALLGGVLSVAVPLVTDMAGYFPPEWNTRISAVIVLLTAFGVYRVPNATPAVVAEDAPKSPPASPPPGGWTNPWRHR